MTHHKNILNGLFFLCLLAQGGEVNDNALTEVSTLLKTFDTKYLYITRETD